MPTSEFYKEQFRLLMQTLKTEFPEEQDKVNVKTFVNHKLLSPDSEKTFETTMYVKFTYADQQSESIPIQNVTEEWVKEQVEEIVAAVDKDAWIGGLYMPKIPNFLKGN